MGDVKDTEKKEVVEQLDTLGRTERKHVNMVIYGRSGAGKTYRAATAPNPYVVACDPKGHDSIPFEVPGKIVHTLDDVLGQVESVKTVASIHAPVSGEIVEVNAELEDATQLLNESPYEEGWVAVIKMDDPSSVEGLFDAAAYREKLGE